MNITWTKADAWYRRDVSDGVSLTVSRTAGGTWMWAMSTGGRGRVGHATALSAMVEADEYATAMYGVAA